VAQTDAALDWLFSLAQFGIKFGLDNIRAILVGLDHPERAFASVHVAGTNGKGSVTAMVEAALRSRQAPSPGESRGYRTGRYTSPHLVDLTERFAVDGTPVSHRELIDAVAAVRDCVERLRQTGALDVHPTFFEVTTATAFELFRRRQVEVAVCEVGLGGRLDATNVLSPMATAITSIGFDHEQYLGRTLEAIAREKAGIIKPQVPVVLGPVAPEAAHAIANVAARRGAPLIDALAGCDIGTPRPAAANGQQFSLRTPARDYGTLTLALPGAHQIVNAAVAVRLLETLDGIGLAVTPQAIAGGLASVRWRGRLEHLQFADGREALLDAAHNASGAQALADYLQTLEGPRPLVFAAMRDKDVASMLQALAPHVTSVYMTRASNPRSAAPADLASLARTMTTMPVHEADGLADALRRAFAEAPRIVVAGSIFLLGDVMKELGPS
jgi:dihydrofolate synthase/folylpolyglutamate synthase